MIDYRQLIKLGDMRKEINFPFSDKKVFLRILNSWEDMDCAKQADDKYKDRDLNFVNQVERQSIKIAAGLVYSIVNEENKQIYPNTEEFLKYTSQDVINKLWKEYCAFQNEQFPSFDNIGEKDISEMIEDIKKNSSLISIISDITLLRKLLIFMVNQQLQQQIGK